jgi:hypothetical protein
MHIFGGFVSPRLPVTSAAQFPLSYNEWDYSSLDRNARSMSAMLLDATAAEIVHFLLNSPLRKS